MVSLADIPVDIKNADFVNVRFTICTVHVFIELQTLLERLNLSPVKHLIMNFNEAVRADRRRRL